MSTTTEERPGTTIDERAERDERDVVATRPETREWLGQQVSGTLALVVGVSWYVLFSLAVALEPAADNPDAIPAWLAGAIDFTLLGLLAVTAAGLITRRRFGLVAALGGAALFLAMAVACPVSGHHTFGTWWYGQMACAIGLVAITGSALRRS
jgi:peptidoglycan/LPS O-acetylase OafA/YrhL